ncbi:MAG: hypothetical protein ABIJ81_03140 [Patescibacteria group bacterium]
MDTMPSSVSPIPQQHSVWAIIGFIVTLISPLFIFINPVLAALPVLVGLIFSIIGLIQTKRNPQMKGKGLAVAGIIIAIVVIVLIVVNLWYIGQQA